MSSRRCSTPLGGAACSGLRRNAVKPYCNARVRPAPPCSTGAGMAQRRGGGVLGLQFTYALQLRQQFGQWRDIVVALQQSGAHAETRIRLAQQRPYRIDDWRAVRVDLEISGFVVMTGHMVVGDAL